MSTQLVLVYVVGAIVTASALAVYWAKKGRWSDTYADHLGVIVLGLGWPVLIPAGLAVLVIELIRYLASNRDQLGGGK